MIHSWKMQNFNGNDRRKISTSFKYSQWLKTLSPINVTDEGIVIFVSDLHCWKEQNFIAVTDDGILLSLNEWK